jgi:GNAT superfamily N-acetyltransferase
LARKKRGAGDGAFRAPEPISGDHDLSNFDSGEPALDDWLRRRAIHNEASGGSRTYVVCEGSTPRVVAYYCLAAGGVASASSPGKIRRNMPDPIPVMVIGRLAVDKAFQGHGLGHGLLRDAVLRTLQATSIVGIRAILVHAISDDAKAFYERCGFRPSPLDQKTLMIPVAEAESSLTARGK